ncbi:Eukaryotic translation initiation factor 5B [Gracilariopsis chorda]|uniref:Eukaryotic translation initiation factor 5B n=1 Tax=Gracilariopsis chorda TaxID=448386 RepID=A0A2V3J0J1_9FLOR|nr:Eukaryotic translation initiation factor 5B [Gracilariopsis chorda]|eukprot:PXF47898.1 Eukaryotic translation initiation factor 5B [Gracilariopsis chorda]
MDDDLFQFEAPTETAPELVLGKKKKKKKKKKDESASKDEKNVSLESNGHGGEPRATTAEEDETAGDAPTTAFAALQIEDGDQNAEDSELFPVAEMATKKKKKKKKKPLELPDPLDENFQLPEPETTEPKEQELLVQERRPMTAAEKKRAKKERERLAKEEKARKEKEELDALLAELDGPKPDENADQSVNTASEPQQEATPASGRKKGKKKGKQAKSTADEVDSLLAELAPPEPKPSETSTPAAEAGVDDLLAELGGVTEGAAPKKKAKKKKKKTAAKADDAAGGAAADDGAASSEPKKPKKKESAMVRRMREAQEKRLAEEERLRKQEEEEARRLEEEQRKKEEEERQKAEEKAKRKAAEKAKRERKKQEGTWLSKAERERRRKAEAFKQQMIKMGRVPAVAQSDAAEAQKVVYGKRRKGHAQKEVQAASTDASKTLETAETEASKTDEKVDETVKAEPEPEVIPDAWDELPDTKPEDEAPLETKDSKVGAETKGRSSANEKELQLKEDSAEESDDEESYDSDDSYYEGMSKTEIASEKRREAIRRSRAKARESALAARTRDHLRSPIICILGHVDTGKTKILDRIRRTNVQDAEAGGITQQIGATYFPIEAVKKEATKIEEGKKLLYNVPSLLIIDTPGHESFTNLRSRGSSLCDIAILVVDIMHGLEPQTRESIDLLKMRKTPFIVALNKIDRMYDWKAQPHNCPTRASLEKQPSHVREEFFRRVKETKLQLAEIGFNTELYWENKDVRKTVSLVPTSAITGEGMPDLLMLLMALPQRLLTERLMFTDVLEATVLEVKVIEGLGTTIDIVLTGGTIHEGDTIMVVGLDGPIVTTIRALLTPHPMKEMRVKGQYLHHKQIKAAQGIKISADGLEKAVAGTQLMVVEDANDEEEMEYVREEVMKDFQTILTSVDRSGLGVYVQASTLGSLEALLEYLRSEKIPVAGINIGPVHKRDVTKASTMLERRKEYATILAFDVPVEKEARELAESEGVQIFTADIIYHLFDQFTAYMERVKKQRREAVNDEVVFPVIAKILPQHVYNKKDPIVVGVDVLEGILRVGTPLVVRHGSEWLDIGRVASIEANKKQVVIAKKGESVAVKIQHKSTEHIMYGRHFDFNNQLVSKMSRSAIDLLKESFKEDLETEDWRLVVKLKTMFNIM